MKFKCRHCGQIIKRDARRKEFKTFMTKRGYESYCDQAQKTTYLIPEEPK